MSNIATLTAAAFKVTTLSAVTAETIENQAQHGRIPAELLKAVTADYGVTLPPSPASFIKTLNTEFLTGKAPAKLAPLVQVLHAVAGAIVASGACKNLRVLAALPEWADPEKIAIAKAATSAKRAATIKAKKAEDKEAEDTPLTAPTVNTMQEHVNAIIAAAKAGALSAAHLTALRMALDVAHAAPGTVPTAAKGGEVIAPIMH